jgi:hypothetical protein
MYYEVVLNRRTTRKSSVTRYDLHYLFVNLLEHSSVIKANSPPAAERVFNKLRGISKSLRFYWSVCIDILACKLIY